MGYHGGGRFQELIPSSGAFFLSKFGQIRTVPPTTAGL